MKPRRMEPGSSSSSSSPYAQIIKKRWTISRGGRRGRVEYLVQWRHDHVAVHQHHHDTTATITGTTTSWESRNHLLAYDALLVQQYEESLLQQLSHCRIIPLSTEEQEQGQEDQVELDHDCDGNDEIREKKKAKRKSLIAESSRNKKRLSFSTKATTFEEAKAEAEAEAEQEEDRNHQQDEADEEEIHNNNNNNNYYNKNNDDDNDDDDDDDSDATKEEEQIPEIETATTTFTTITTTTTGRLRSKYFSSKTTATTTTTSTQRRSSPIPPPPPPPVLSYKAAKSPHNLIQESLTCTWQMLVSCIMLNVTTGRQVKPIFEEFMRRYPTPLKVIAANAQEMAELIKPLGLCNKRTNTLKRFSREFLTKQWSMPEELYGIGRYGNDAYKIFVLGQWRETNPTDKELLRYVQFMRSSVPASS